MKDRPTNSFRSLLVGSSLVGVHFVVFCLVLFYLVKVVPISTYYFEDMELDLPALTINLITLSDFTVAYWFLMPVFFFLVDVPVLIATSFLQPAQRWIRGCWFVGWLVVAILLFVAGSVALSMPLAFTR